MMKYLQRLGKSLMMPVALLPVVALLVGIGYYIDPQNGNYISKFLTKTGFSILNNMSILFAVGVSLGMSKEKDGLGALSGLVAFLIITTLLSTENVAYLKGIDIKDVSVAFNNINNPFMAINSGLVASSMYNMFYKSELPEFFAFFSGKRLVPIVTSIAMVIVSAIFLFIWPIIFVGLMTLGVKILALGPIGAGIYGLLNRLLIPVGLHHILNFAFWFDLIGINDMGRFFGSSSEVMRNLPPLLDGTYKAGMYQAGLFPIMMFGLPGAALAIYLTSKKERRAEIGALMLSASVASFFTGVTEPLEFSFMFVAPLLYLLHAILTGFSLMLASFIGSTAGFGFSSGLMDYVLSLRNPNSHKPLLLIPIGLLFFIIYFVLFYFTIKMFNLKTPGREDNVVSNNTEKTYDNKFAKMAAIILEGLGGKENITAIDNCATRLRLELVDSSIVDQNKIKSSGAFGISIIDSKMVQVVVGPKVEFVATELKKISE